jgi:hypothetical protein
MINVVGMTTLIDTASPIESTLKIKTENKDLRKNAWDNPSSSTFSGTLEIEICEGIDSELLEVALEKIFNSDESIDQETVSMDDNGSIVFDDIQFDWKISDLLTETGCCIWGERMQRKLKIVASRI